MKLIKVAIDSAAKAVGGTALKPLQREAFVVVRPGKVDYLFRFER